MPAPTSPLTPELCRTFVALVRLNGSAAAVARELGLNEASVSKRLRPLVRGAPPHLPRPWLAKRGKRFHPTDEGRAMLPAAADEADRWARFAALAAAPRGPGLAVACGQEAAGGVVLTAVTAVRRGRPDVAVRVAMVRGRRRIEGVADGRYDVALVTCPPAEAREASRRDLTIDPLADDELVLACGAGAPWATAFADGAVPVGFAQLPGWPLVLPDPAAAIRRQWDERVRRHGHPAPPAVAVEAGGWSWVM